MIFFTPITWLLYMFMFMVVFFLFILYPVPMILITVAIIWGLVSLHKKGKEAQWAEQ